MSNRLTTKFHRYLAEIGIAVSSIISPTSMHVEPILPEKKRKSPSLQDALGSDVFNQHKDWEGIRYFDDRLRRYTRLDDMVNFSEPDEKTGLFWDKVSHKNIIENTIPYFVLEGIRSDGKEFSIKEAAIKDEYHSLDEIFDIMCVELNKKLRSEA